MTHQQNKIKILSLDGGGVRGLLTARVLKNIETRLNEELGESKNLGERFDLISGTSTGAIIALALAAGASAKNILEFYENNIERIFPTPKSKLCTGIKWLFRPKYKARDLKEALKELFAPLEAKTLADLSTPHVCITSVSLASAKLRLHKSRYFSRNSGRDSELLCDIAYASAAAPTYFAPQQTLKESGALVDGGLCANNPAMVALIDAINILRGSSKSSKDTMTSNELENICLLSVGTGKMCHMPYDSEKLLNKGMKGWMLSIRKKSSPLLELIMQSQSDMTHEQMRFLLGEKYYRINPQLHFEMALDDTSRVNDLKNLADINLDMDNWVIKQLINP